MEDPMSENTERLHKIVIQPNPRSPVHYRGNARMFSEPLMGKFTFEGQGEISKHWWSWSPAFWWRILLAWIRPEKPEEAGRSDD